MDAIMHASFQLQTICKSFNDDDGHIKNQNHYEHNHEHAPPVRDEKPAAKTHKMPPFFK